jgi:hypothetical protein
VTRDAGDNSLEKRIAIGSSHKRKNGPIKFPRAMGNGLQRRCTELIGVEKKSQYRWFIEDTAFLARGYRS